MTIANAAINHDLGTDWNTMRSNLLPCEGGAIVMRIEDGEIVEARQVAGNARRGEGVKLRVEL